MREDVKQDLKKKFELLPHFELMAAFNVCLYSQNTDADAKETLEIIREEMQRRDKKEKLPVPPKPCPR